VQQLLAQLGYLPLRWQPTGAVVFLSAIAWRSGVSLLARATAS